MSEWESVSSQRGSFYGWANQTGQSVTGNVLSIGTGKDINENPVPELQIELTEATKSFSKSEWSEIESGEVITLTCGQSNLKKGIIAAKLNAGDAVKITLDSLFPTAKGNAKIFDVKVRRGTAPPVTQTTFAPPQQTSFGPVPAAHPNDFVGAPPF